MTAPDASSDLETGMTGLAVRLRRATKIYDTGVAALGPFDLDVRRGEFISLLGPSGCGKSTALRLIAGLGAPTSGTVEVWHRPVDVRGTHSIGFVFQEPTLMPWARVWENVRLPLKLSRMPAAQADTRIGEALAQVGLSDFSESYPRELSGGMKMRVSLARALVTDPDILLMTSRSRRSTRPPAFVSTTICWRCGGICARPSSSSPTRYLNRSICRSA